MRDDDVAAIQEWLQVAGIVQAARPPCSGGGYLLAQQILPSRSRLSQVSQMGWRGAPGDLAKEYLGVEDSEYASAIRAVFLISMVARVIEPGSKVDYVPILKAHRAR